MFKAPTARELFLETLNKTTFGSLEIQFPKNNNISPYRMQGTQSGPAAQIQILNDKTFSMILNKGDIGLGESYIQGDWESPAIDDLIEWAVLNKKNLAQAVWGLWYKILIYKIKHLLKANTRSQSVKNIQAHYDLGNEFYQLWLDPSMTYSSAFWGDQKQLTLEQAQKNKYEQILKSLSAKKGDHILEIGCGWGGFAEYAAQQGFRVTGLTISHEQYAFARNRIQKSGLAQQVEILFKDYRLVEGQFDHVVSIEMLEAVGEKYWPTFFEQIRRRVKKGGRVAIQTIVINDHDFPSYRKGTDFIQQYIFPGGMLPCESVLKKLISKIHGKNYSTLFFGKDYACTLLSWHKEFIKQKSNLHQLGFDTSFQKMWEFYLLYCAGAFRSGQINVQQIYFEAS